MTEWNCPHPVAVGGVSNALNAAKKREEEEEEEEEEEKVNRTPKFACLTIIPFLFRIG